MSSRQALIALLIVVLVGAGGAWLYANFEVVTEKQKSGYSSRALRDPWLAAQRLVQRMGALATSVRALPNLRTLPPSAVLVLPAQRHTISQPLRAAVLAWVEKGGHLIIEAEHDRQPDPFLEALGVERKRIGNPDDEDERREEIVEVLLPGSTVTSRVEMDKGLSIESPAAEFRFDGDAATHVLLARQGAGRVIVLNDLSFATNRWIGAHDHAQFLWELVSLAPGRPAVHFFNNPGQLSFWEWLRENAWAPLAGGAAAILLWLWRTAPRLGPVAPDPERARRRLLDHLRASGRFLWSHGGAQRMLEAARDSCLRRVGRAHPDFLATAEADRPRRLAELLGWTEDRARRVLEPSAPASMMEFLQTVSHFQAVHEQLALKAPALPRKTR